MDDMKTPSRRGLLGMATALSASAGIAIATGGKAQAQTKVDQAAVQYQPTPKDGQQCSTCVNFAPPAACNIVAGVIAATGYCIAYAPKA